MTDLVNVTVGGKYKLERLIGQGGMGAVYEAKHVEIGRRVAVKVLTSTHRDHPEVHARFRREARATSAVESEHIVQVIDAGNEPDVGLFMVMELLSGEDLETRLRREKRLDAELMKGIAKQALRGLAKAHAAGVVHRDLKPANIFLISKEDGSLLVKVVDFGISKFADTAESTQPGTAITRVGNVIGTALYMSPEQAQGLPSLDHRTDVWSMGALLYECLAGSPPIAPAPTYEQTMVRIVTMRPAPLLDVAPWVPESVAAAVDLALRHSPDERHADCAAFLRALDGEAPVVRTSTLPLSVSATGPLWGHDRVSDGGIAAEPAVTQLASVTAIGHTQSGEGVAITRGSHRSRTTAFAFVGLIAAVAVFVAVLLSRQPAATPPQATASSPVSAPEPSLAASPPRDVEPSPPASVATAPATPPSASAPHASLQATLPKGAGGSPHRPPAPSSSAAKAPAPSATAAPRAFGGAGVTDKF